MEDFKDSRANLMKINFDSDNEKPIFQQLAEELENSILKGIYREETQIPSTTEIAVKLKINPATANRGVNMLVDEGIIYKRRGVGMYVTSGAREKISVKRKQSFYRSFILPLLEESENLDIPKEDIIAMIKRGDE
jgi:DNA-binding transcriptional regulator YhcF (GntR family)